MTTGTTLHYVGHYQVHETGQNAAAVHRHSFNSGGHARRHEDNVLGALEHEKQVMVRIEVHIRLRLHRA